MKQTALTLILGFSIAMPLLAKDSTPTPAAAAASANNIAEVTNQFAPFNDERQRASYALGMLMAHQWQSQGVDLDFDLVARGMKDVRSGQMLITPQQMQAALDAYRQKIIAEQQKMRENIAAENKMKGEEFFAENKKKEGVVTLPSGLQYKIISAGKGPKPGTNEVVRVNYRGMLLDGTEFDTTAKRGQPSEFPLSGGIIAGWKEALPLMPAGSVWEIYIPSQLGYGEAGRPPLIPANSTLIFTVQLISSAPPGVSQSSNNNPPLVSDIIAVPSAADLKKGKQPYTIKPEQIQQMQQTNSASKR
jgi:FKBP-type peptidyl-prolyl cis-trans isomerase FklB